jgi:BMFP domain-containing protein YqiC
VQRLRIRAEEKRAQQAREHLRWLRQRIDELESRPRDPAREYLLAKYRAEIAAGS